MHLMQKARAPPQEFWKRISIEKEDKENLAISFVSTISDSSRGSQAPGLLLNKRPYEQSNSFHSPKFKRVFILSNNRNHKQSVKYGMTKLDCPPIPYIKRHYIKYGMTTNDLLRILECSHRCGYIPVKEGMHLMTKLSNVS